MMNPRDRIDVRHGDSRELLRAIADDSVDSVVCDPPYALVSIGKRFGKPGAAPAKGNDAYMQASRGFMSTSWDNGSTAFDPDFWREVLRVMKPGAHLLAFGGTRSYHRLACAIEDAGAEIRDCIFYCYGSGFPKSLDVSKQIDKAAGAQREIVGRHTGRKATPCCDIRGGSYVGGVSGGIDCSAITAPATDAAREWQGWGTALKPSHEILCVAQKPLSTFSPDAELICLARKPLSERTIAANVLKHGVGALNIDACRVGTDVETWPTSRSYAPGQKQPGGHGVTQSAGKSPAGRWPANLCHDNSPEVVAAFPDTHDGGAKDNRGVTHSAFSMDVPRTAKRDDAHTGFGNSSGSAARFFASFPCDERDLKRLFYSSKADSDDRLGSSHPTVKPVDLICWLIRLVTPKNGLVLDMFAGSGTTGEAAFREGMRCILMEREAAYVADIERRISLLMSGPDERARETVKASGRTADAGPLFGGLSEPAEGGGKCTGRLPATEGPDHRANRNEAVST